MATVSYSIIAEKDSRRLKIFSLKVELVSEESRVAIMNAIKQRCEDLKTNIVLFIVPEDEKLQLAGMGFLEPFDEDIWLAERHREETGQGQVLLFFRPPNYRHDSYGPIQEKKEVLLSELAKQTRRRLDEFNNLWNPKTLEAEFKRRKGTKCFQKNDKAQRSDQYETTQRVKRRIARLYGLKEADIWDPCSLNRGFRKDFFFDALEDLWPLNKNISTNWPYSLNQFFLIKASLEMQRGCNILSLMNCRSTDSKVADEIPALIYRRNIVGSITFKNIPVTNGQSHCILEFLQPEFYNEHQIDKFADNLVAKNPLLRELIKSPKKQDPKNTKFEEDTIVQLLKNRWTRAQIQSLYPIGDHAIADIRKRYVDELEGLANPDKIQARKMKNDKRRAKYKEEKDDERATKVQKVSQDKN